MAVEQPQSTDKLNSPSHSLMHRQIASDASAPAESISVDATGKVSFLNGSGINEISTDGTLSGDSDLVLVSEKAIKAYVDAAVAAVAPSLPSGTIVMWSGSVASIPSGYVICDGTNSTPNLQDRFVVGAGSTYAVDATGGAATHTLTTAEMPSHTHTLDAANSGNSGTVDLIKSGANVSGGFTTGSAGSGGAHNNMPPYYALAYIMKT